MPEQADDDLSAAWTRAMLREDFPAAWAIADAVLGRRPPGARDDPARPYHERWVWDGRALDGRPVTVRCFHGLGDTVQFARFLPTLRARAAHVTLEVQPALLPLLRRMDCLDRVVPFDPARPVRGNNDIEIMELPHALRAVPDGEPYLHAAPVAVPGATVGVCWQAGSWDPQRSIPLAELRAVLPAGAVSLQRGADGLPDPLAGAMDVLQTAGLVASLPCVVTVDTMVAHLAGALGRPVHLLLRADADWRWGRGGRTVWYRNTRIHRQRRPGDWSAALGSLADALRAAG